MRHDTSIQEHAWQLSSSKSLHRMPICAPLRLLVQTQPFAAHPWDEGMAMQAYLALDPLFYWRSF